MRRIAVVLIGLATLSVGCAEPFAIHGRPYTAVAPRSQPVNVVGRWDNVMMLPAGSRVIVLLMDGTRVEGEIDTASATALKVTVAAGQVEFAAGRIARIDRTAGSSRIQSGLSGAVHGLGAMGVLGLLSGQVPPLRAFAGAGLAAADVGIHANQGYGPETVYVARQLTR